MPNLDKYLDKPVKKLIYRKPNKFSEEQIERHNLYSNLLCAITAHYFNGNKYGDNNQYPLNPKGLKTDNYFGHNIAAIAVNRLGQIIDFEFNHNKIFNSSVEHAESRLIRRVFSLTQVYNSWEESNEESKRYGNLLSEVSVYTSLESCTQCTGIMTLGDVKNVIYLQDDPGMYHIGNIVKNLTDGQGYIEAPLPISGKEIKLPLYQKLNKAYKKFIEQQNSKEGEPFVIFENGEKKYTSSITSFLCTNAAYKIFSEGTKYLSSVKLKHPKFKPDTDAISNMEALKECKSFYEYATTKGKRGTPHRM